MNTHTLGGIAANLEALEETIILKLIDRAQFRRNPVSYEPGKSGFTGESQDSLFQIRLKRHEHMDAEFGRFNIPEERPFSDGLPEPRRKVTGTDRFLNIDDYNHVNLTKEIIPYYLKLLDEICIPGDDHHYGSSVEHDVYALQAVSRRIHYGSFYVAERKYRDRPEDYSTLIQAENTKAIEQLLTRTEVEERIIRRVGEKLNIIQATVNSPIRHLIQVSAIQQFYQSAVIPLTKKGEVTYLIHRKQT